MENWNGIVSLFIACIELLLLINLIIFSEKNRINIIICFIILLLTVYQIFEFIICGVDLTSSLAAYFAFVDISFLPPLNLLLVLAIFKPKFKLKYIAFIPAVFFIIYYLFSVEQFEVVVCTVLYATYNYPLGDLYGFFYYLPIVISAALLFLKKREISTKAFAVLLIAHVFIIVPVIVGFTLLYLNLPGVIGSMESILCKFAFGYAVALSIFCLGNKKEKNE